MIRAGFQTSNVGIGTRLALIGNFQFGSHLSFQSFNMRRAISKSCWRIHAQGHGCQPSPRRFSCHCRGRAFAQANVPFRARTAASFTKRSKRCGDKRKLRCGARWGAACSGSNTRTKSRAKATSRSRPRGNGFYNVGVGTISLIDGFRPQWLKYRQFHWSSPPSSAALPEGQSLANHPANSPHD